MNCNEFYTNISTFLAFSMSYLRFFKDRTYYFHNSNFVEDMPISCNKRIKFCLVVQCTLSAIT